MVGRFYYPIYLPFGDERRPTCAHIIKRKILKIKPFLVCIITMNKKNENQLCGLESQELSFIMQKLSGILLRIIRDIIFSI